MTRLLVALAFLLANGAPAKERWVSYEPAVVVLRGKFITELQYGPPNFGENPDTDEKGDFPFLVLEQPINVHAEPTDELNDVEETDVTKLQLVFVHGPASEKLYGRSVVVTGTLFHGFNGHHYTSVLLIVRKISLTASTHSVKPR